MAHNSKGLMQLVYCLISWNGANPYNHTAEELKSFKANPKLCNFCGPKGKDDLLGGVCGQRSYATRLAMEPRSCSSHRPH